MKFYNLCSVKFYFSIQKAIVVSEREKLNTGCLLTTHLEWRSAPALLLLTQ